MRMKATTVVLNEGLHQIWRVIQEQEEVEKDKEIEESDVMMKSYFAFEHSFSDTHFSLSNVKKSGSRRSEETNNFARKTTIKLWKNYY